ncbi:hypothetical protein D9M68_884600 [compost metagenome]
MLGIAEHGLAGNFTPLIAQAAGIGKEVEQQPAALAGAETLHEQLRRAQALFGKQARALGFTGKMPLGLAANQQLGQNGPPLPLRLADITLPRQYAQQALHLHGRTSDAIDR